MAKLVSRLTNIARKMPEARHAALLQTGKDIYEISQQLVPVDTSSLKLSGGVVPVSSNELHVGYGVEGVFIEGREPAEYAAHVEYGTDNSPAQPFLTPAFVESTRTFKVRIQQEMRKIIAAR